MAELLQIIWYASYRILLLVFPGFGSGNLGWQQKNTVVGLINNEPILMLCICLIFITSIISIFNRIRRLM